MLFLGHCVGKIGDCVEWWPLTNNNVVQQHRPAAVEMTAEAFHAAAIAGALNELQKHKTYFAKRSVLLCCLQQPTQTRTTTTTAEEEEPSEERPVLVPLHILRIQHATDVAAILEALVRTQENSAAARSSMAGSPSTPVDRARVARDLTRGDAPWVPPPPSHRHQWFLKRSMDLFFRRGTVAFFSAGPYRRASLCYFPVRQHPGVRGHVALTLDDAPGRFGGNHNCSSSSSSSVLEEVRLLLKQYNAKATFMMVGSFLRAATERNVNNAPQQQQQQEEVLIRLLQDGHEFGNHGGTDHPHHRMASDADFVAAVNDCSQQIRVLQQKANETSDTTNNATADGVHYFRAPHGKYTKRMRDLLRDECHSGNNNNTTEGRGGLMNVMCDAYASDPLVQDGAYIARSLTRQARHGGIILLHMPEALGFRDHCLVALRGLLEGLTQQRQLRVVSVGMLHALARDGQ